MASDFPEPKKFCGRKVGVVVPGYDSGWEMPIEVYQYIHRAGLEEAAPLLRRWVTESGHDTIYEDTHALLARIGQDEPDQHDITERQRVIDGLSSNEVDDGTE